MGSNWQWSQKQGRAKRLAAEADARQHGTPFNPEAIPLHSHDGTMQSKFAYGWRSVTEVDIRHHISGDTTYHAVSQRLAQQFGERYDT
jgi:hypothetical protein